MGTGLRLGKRPRRRGRLCTSPHALAAELRSAGTTGAGNSSSVTCRRRVRHRAAAPSGTTLPPTKPHASRWGGAGVAGTPPPTGRPQGGGGCPEWPTTCRTSGKQHPAAQGQGASGGGGGVRFRRVGVFTASLSAPHWPGHPGPQDSSSQSLHPTGETGCALLARSHRWGN